MRGENICRDARHARHCSGRLFKPLFSKSREAPSDYTMRADEPEFAGGDVPGLSAPSIGLARNRFVGVVRGDGTTRQRLRWHSCHMPLRP
jgi:hypothetical protein